MNEKQFNAWCDAGRTMDKIWAKLIEMHKERLAEWREQQTAKPEAIEFFPLEAFRIPPDIAELIQRASDSSYAAARQHRCTPL